MNVLLNWWQAATAEEKKALAAFCNTTEETLRQEAHAYRTKGVLQISLGRAAYIQNGTMKLERDGLPRIKRADICPLWVEIDALENKHDKSK